MKKNQLVVPVFLISICSFATIACGAVNDGQSDGQSDSKGNAELAQPSELDMAVLTEINLARANPKSYAETYIAPLASRFSAEYFNECIAEMKELAPLAAYTYNSALWHMAKAHADTQGPSGAIGHDRTDGRNFKTVLKDYCASYSSAGENISYGYNAARDIVIQLLVDDGVESRGHRKNILNSAYTQAGAAVTTHSKYRHMCVIDFANGCVAKE